MEDRGFDTVRAQFLEHLGRFSEAAQIYLEEGQTIKAIPLLLKDRHSPQSAERASLSLLEGLRNRLPFGSSPRAHAAKTDTVVSALCDMLNSKDLEMAKLRDDVRQEVSYPHLGFCRFAIDRVDPSCACSERLHRTRVMHQSSSD